MKTILVAALAAASAWAVETKSWQQGDFSDFEKGKLTRLSLSSAGRLSLAPVVKELADASSPYLWSVVSDSKGNVYAGAGGSTGTTAKLWRIDSGGKATVVAELEGLGIHALAVDRSDVVYAATSPDGKVYRVKGNKAEPFYEPKSKYVWGMAFNAAGDLFVATGEKAEIHKVSADGKGSVYLKLEENHARALAIDGQGNLIVGTEPSGLVMRVAGNAAAGAVPESFVLYQTAKREVTSVTIAKDGSIYAAAMGSRTQGQSPMPPLPIPVPVPTPAPAPPGAGGAARPAPVPSPVPQVTLPPASGGSEVYRIFPDGFPRRIWSAPAIAYALVIDGKDRPVVATGNQGNLYRIDTDQSFTLLTSLAPTQITALARGKGDAVIAVTGNIGKVFAIGPQLEREGTYDSETFDASSFSYWGRVSHQAKANGGSVRFETRSGNLNSPQANWSGWSAVPQATGRSASPAARFVQYRAMLTAGSDGKSPELQWVDLAYQVKNVPPFIEEIEITPANYRFPAPPTLASSGGAASISLPPLGQKRRANVPMDLNSPATLNYAKGFLGARWLVNDDNGDTLRYTVEIRGVGETEWKLLKDKVNERQLSWDTGAYADGEYVLRVTATDAPSNTPEQALTAVRESDEFLIDNSGPKIEALTARLSSGKIEASWTAKDALSVLTKVEYSLNGGDWTVAEPTTRLTDAQELSYKLSIDKPAGNECTLAVRAADEFDNQTVEKSVVR